VDRRQRETREVVVTLTNNAERGAHGRRPRRANPRANNLAGTSFAGARRTTIRRRSRSAGTSSRSRAIRGERSRRQGQLRGDAFAIPTACASIRPAPVDHDGHIADAPQQGRRSSVRQQPAARRRPATGAFRRFLTGPSDARSRGSCSRPTGAPPFVNIQHPGEIGGESNDPANPRAHSNWPDYRPDGRPRSATVVIQRTTATAIRSILPSALTPFGGVRVRAGPHSRR
jgi:secreted PhoX family phosphatase